MPLTKPIKLDDNLKIRCMNNKCAKWVCCLHIKGWVFGNLYLLLYINIFFWEKLLQKQMLRHKANTITSIYTSVV